MLNKADVTALRQVDAETLLKEAGKPESPRFWPIVDGLFFQKSPIGTFKAGEQARVPLLAGWNSQEMTLPFLMGDQAPTPENYKQMLEARFGATAQEILKLYPGDDAAAVEASGNALAGDLFIGYSTWKMIDVPANKTQAPVFRYFYAHPRPPMVAEMGNARAGLAGGVVHSDADEQELENAATTVGAVHSAEIEYALGNLENNKVFDWNEADFKVSSILQTYFVNFIKNHNPNGASVPEWPEFQKTNMVMEIKPETEAIEEQTRQRYLLLDKIAAEN